MRMRMDISNSSWRGGSRVRGPVLEKPSAPPGREALGLRVWYDYFNTVNVKSGMDPPACTVIVAVPDALFWWVTVNEVVLRFAGVPLPSIVRGDPVTAKFVASL